MNIDAFIYIEKVALQTLWDAAHPSFDDEGVPTVPIPDNARMLMHSAVRGFWNDLDVAGTLYEVVNVVQPIRFDSNGDRIDELHNFLTLNAADIHGIDAWVHGTGIDFDTPYRADPARVLSVMKNHDVYDEFGTLISSTPPTYENPNWGHAFSGQSFDLVLARIENGSVIVSRDEHLIRKVARDFSDDFDRSFI